MRQTSWLIFSLAVYLPLRAEKQEVYSRSFMFTRPLSYNVAALNHLWHRVTTAEERNGAFQAIGLFQQSTPLKKSGRYFTFGCKDVFTVIGDDATPAIDRSKRDIRAEYVGLPATFSGSFTVTPKQKQVGGIINYHQPLGWITCFDSAFFQNMWLSCSIALTKVTNSINLHECTVTNRGEGPLTSIPDAFNQPDWCYAKFCPHEQSKTGVEEVRLMAGSTYEHSPQLELIYYTLCTLPACGKPDPGYIFSPQLGNGGHVGWGGGMHMNLLLTETNPFQCAWYFFIALEGSLLVRNTPHRTFDLKNKPWSRYLLYNIEDCPPTNTPGVNLLTLRVRSRPYNLADFSIGWRFYANCFELELAYNVWGHGDERLHFTRPLCTSFGIAGSGTSIDPLGNSVANSSSKSTINQKSPNDPAFVRITFDDIDLHSAEAASAINHRIHMAIGFDWEGDQCSFILGGGFFYEIAQKNSPLQLWGFWGKMGIGF